MSDLARPKSILLAGLSFLALAISHIPDSLFRHGFDKDAPAQFFGILLIAGIFALVIARRPSAFSFHKVLISAIGFLIFALFLSLATSGNLAGSFFGDSGRFVGVASVLALLVISTFHASFKYEDFIYLLRYYILAIEVVAILGVAQHFNFIELPGDAGVASTLGNTDFFAAFLGTSFPLLILLALTLSRNGKFLIGGAAALNIYALYLAGPLQGYLDIAFVVTGGLIYLLRRYIPRRELGLNVRTFLGTFAVIIWAEFIFLMPFLGKSIPVLGSDIQVQIRGNFWLAGMKQFFAHPFTGVGPDNYGNYYEQYRTLEDLSQYARIVSNDAHSASVQTLATLGLIGSLAFLTLITIMIRSLFILWDNRTINRRALYLIGLYIFVYLTNSFISPITLTHKYLFWAVAGFVIGSAYRKTIAEGFSLLPHRLIALSLAAILFITAGLFAAAQLNYLTHIEKYAVKSSSASSYQSSSPLPCFMYFDAEIKMVAQAGDQQAIAFARQALAKNPRCISAELFLARMNLSRDEVAALKPHIYRLMEIAPARSETISIGMYYANRSGDEKVALRLQRIMEALGLIYLPGKLG